MPRMKALKTFIVGGTGVTVSPGVEFETSSAKSRFFEANGMAVEVHRVPKVAQVDKVLKDENVHSGLSSAEPSPRPTSPPGGPTGEGKPLLSSDLAPAQPKRRYTKRAAKRES